MDKETQEIGTLQTLINERAKKKLTKDLKNLAESIAKHPLLTEQTFEGVNFPQLCFIQANEMQVSPPPDNIVIKVFKVADLTNMNLTDLISVNFEVGHRRGNYSKALFDYWLPIYIKRETEEFINKFDQLKEDVNNLQNKVDSIGEEY